MSAKRDIAAPTGRKKTDQGKERSDATLCQASHNTSSPEGAEETGEISTGWKSAPLGELCERITKGSSPNWQGFDYCESGIVFVRSQNVGWGDLKLDEVAHLPAAFNDKEKKSVLKAEDVLLNLVGASIGRACVATSEVDGGNVNQAVAVIRVRRDVLTPKFLVHFLISPAAQSRIHSEKVDVARANFSLEDTRSLSIPLPPLPEQRRIVAEIEKQFTRLEAGVTALRRVQANLKRYRAAILKAACEGRLVPSDLRAWKRLKVSEIGETITGNTPPTNDEENLGDELPFFKPTDLDAGYNVREARQYLSTKGAKYARVLPAGAVLVTCIGATIGKTGFARVDCATNQQINAWVVNPKVAIPGWAFWLVSSPLGQQQVKSKASATTLPILNKSKFKALEFPIPPLAEQTRIVAEVERRLSVVEELESVVTANLQRATRLRQAILQRAFTGELI